MPATGEGRGEGDRKWFLQARNTADMHQWVEVINNLAGSQVPFLLLVIRQPFFATYLNSIDLRLFVA